MFTAKEQKDVKIEFRLTKKQKEEVQKMASLKGFTVSEYIMSLLGVDYNA